MEDIRKAWTIANYCVHHKQRFVSPSYKLVFHHTPKYTVTANSLHRERHDVAKNYWKEISSPVRVIETDGPLRSTSDRGKTCGFIGLTDAKRFCTSTCFCPPESWKPPSPTPVSYPRGKLFNITKSRCSKTIALVWFCNSLQKETLVVTDWALLTAHYCVDYYISTISFM